MSYRNFKFVIQYRPDYDGSAFYLRAEDATGKRVAFRLVEQDAQIVAPAMLDMPLSPADARDFLQAIVDEAAKVQIVPGDSANTIAAMKAHLEDMRTLALKGVARDEDKK